MKNYTSDMDVNIGSGYDVTILELAKLICEIVGFDGEIVKDLEKPDGTPRKLMDSQRLHDLGWTPAIGLKEGLASAYQDWLGMAVNGMQT